MLALCLREISCVRLYNDGCGCVDYSRGFDYPPGEEVAMTRRVDGPIGAPIRAAMAERGWTGYRAANEANVNEDSVYRRLGGKQRLRLDTAEPLATALG